MILTSSFSSYPVQAQSDSIDASNFGDSKSYPETVILTDGGFQLEKPKLEIVVVESEFQRKNRLSEESLPEVLKQIRTCESHNNYEAQNAHSSASGAFQIVKGTWNNYEGYPEAKLAPKYVQDSKAKELYAQRGVSPWVQCYKPYIAISDGDFEVIGKDNYRNCVAYAKAETGINRPMGAGARSAIQGHEPRVGAIGSLVGRPHAVVVEAINGNQITFRESNFSRQGLTRRTLPLSQFIGFVYV